jgi:GntR family transcriptional regulator/MocR family aminotransferase
LHLLVTLPDDSLDDVKVADDLREAGVLVHPLSWHRRLSVVGSSLTGAQSF